MTEKKQGVISLKKENNVLTINNVGTIFDIGKGGERLPLVSQKLGFAQRNPLPDEEDYIEVPFRLISATIVGAGTWKATDFSDEKVLRNSIPKIKDIPVYKDHNTYSVDNVVGKIVSPTWGNSFIDITGINVPAGIDGLVRVNKKENSKIAANLIDGAIHSNSVTVYFDWQPSHDFQDDWEFENNVGRIINGEMVRRIVTKIHDYYESSLVWLGADPYAKLKDSNGNLKQIDTASIFSKEISFAKEQQEVKDEYTAKSKYYIFETQKDKIKLINYKMEELLMLLRSELGLGADAEVTAEQLQTYFKLTKDIASSYKELTKNVDDINEYELVARQEFAAVRNEVINLTSEKTELQNKVSEIAKFEKQVTELTAELIVTKEKVTSLENTVNENKEFVTEGQKFVTSKREEVILRYKQSAKLVDDNVLAMFSRATSAELDGLLKQYLNDVTSKFTATCAACGSHDFTFRSSFADEKVVEETRPYNSEELREKYTKKTL